MKIIEYKKCSNNKYELKMDDGEKYKLYDDIILRYELLIYKEVSPSKLKEIIEANQVLEAYYKALKYLNVKMRSEIEIRRYLLKYEIDDNTIKLVIERLKKEGYLNEKKYAEAYVNDSINLTSDGPLKIKQALLKNKISINYIDEYLSLYSDDFWIERINAIISKYARINNHSEAIFKKNMYSKLLLLGYEGEMINNCLHEFKVDDTKSFSKEADKEWNRLLRKCDTQNVKYYFKEKMYKKGYNTELINSYLSDKYE